MKAYLCKSCDKKTSHLPKKYIKTKHKDNKRLFLVGLDEEWVKEDPSKTCECGGHFQEKLGSRGTNNGYECKSCGAEKDRIETKWVKMKHNSVSGKYEFCISSKEIWVEEDPSLDCQCGGQFEEVYIRPGFSMKDNLFQKYNDPSSPHFWKNGKSDFEIAGILANPNAKPY